MKKFFFIFAALIFIPTNSVHASPGILESCSGASICDSGLHCSAKITGADVISFDKGVLCLPEPDFAVCGQLGNCSKNTNGDTYCATVQALNDISKYGMSCLNALEVPQASNASNNCTSNADCKIKGTQCVKIASWTTDGLDQLTSVTRCVDLNKIPPAVVDQSLIPAATAGQTFSQFAPQLEVSIPGLKFDNQITAKATSGTEMRIYSVPYIASYINAIYKYAIGMAVIIATIMIMFAGFLWMTSLGNAKTAGQSKHMIGNAALGLGLAFGAYTILYIVNPNLVNLNAIKILAPKQEIFWVDQSGFDDVTDGQTDTAPSVAITPGQIPPFKQCNPIWKDVPYLDKNGNQITCTKYPIDTICTSGCGVVSLASVLVYNGYSETPATIAAWAAGLGAHTSCTGGTNAQMLCNNISTKFPDLKCTSLNGKDPAAIAAIVKQGHPVDFSCHACSGQTAQNTPRTYKAHYMVITGVSADGQTFDILDGGSSNPAKAMVKLPASEFTAGNVVNAYVVQKK
ncbi:MAG: C39 family peptidase [Candidatus Magasanikbacteria bacterium]|nr:C39 family peptidase [Candidatus Magasanikbacteria bacterium]